MSTIGTDPIGLVRPLCFVLMPFGTKLDASGKDVHFDRVYRDVIHPAVAAAGLDCLRADEEQVGGIIHAPMYARLLLCDFAVADLTLANPNVFYELGIRHAVRPFSTVLIAARGSRRPFDVDPLRVLHYDLDDAGNPGAVAEDVEAVRTALVRARAGVVDSPVFQLVARLRPPDLSGLNSQAFRERERDLDRLRRRVRQAEFDGTAALDALQADLGEVHNVEPVILVELLHAFRGAQAYQQMITLVDAMPAAVAERTPVREQYALALNRVGRGRDAEELLRGLLDERGPSSETFGLLGRVYKDRWEAALRDGDGDGADLAGAWLDMAITEYRNGFDADPTDVYPGVNAVELMYLRDPDDPELAELLTVVRYSANLRARHRTGYWDCATLMQLAVMRRDQDDARRWLRASLATQPDAMESASTADSLRRLAAALADDDPDRVWIGGLERTLRSVGGVAGEGSGR